MFRYRRLSALLVKKMAENLSSSESAATERSSNASPESPFDSDPGADVILLSSDGFEFRARMAILSFASPVFDDMFSLPQPGPDKQKQYPNHKPPLPLIQLSETKTVIDILLRYCYPVPLARGMNDFDVAIAARSAAEKYDMDYIKGEIDNYIEEHFGGDPRYRLILYREAYERREDAQVQFQALYCLRFPLPTLVRLWKTSSSNSSLQKLVEYHLAVSARVVNHISQYSRINHIIKSCCPSCNVSGTYKPRWWYKNIASIVSNVYEKGPTSRHILPHRPDPGSLCIQCHRNVSSTWNAMEERFNENVEWVAEKVCLTLFLIDLN